MSFIFVKNLNFRYLSKPYPGLRLESLAAAAAAAAAAIAAEPQPQAFDPDWYPYRKIREYKRKTSLFSTTSFLLILYVPSKIFRFPGSNPKPLHVSSKGISGPKWSLHGLPKKIHHLGIKID